MTLLVLKAPLHHSQADLFVIRWPIDRSPTDTGMNTTITPMPHIYHGCHAHRPGGSAFTAHMPIQFPPSVWGVTRPYTQMRYYVRHRLRRGQGWPLLARGLGRAGYCCAVTGGSGPAGRTSAVIQGVPKVLLHPFSGVIVLLCCIGTTEKYFADAMAGPSMFCSWNDPLFCLKPFLMELRAVSRWPFSIRKNEGAEKGKVNQCIHSVWPRMTWARDLFLQAPTCLEPFLILFGLDDYMLKWLRSRLFWRAACHFWCGVNIVFSRFNGMWTCTVQ